MPGKKLIYLIALIQFCIILSLFLWLYHPGHLFIQIIQTGFLHAIWISISTQNFIYCKQKEASSSFIVTVKIILYLYGTSWPPDLTTHIVTAQTIHSTRYKTPKNCLQRPRKICCIFRQSELELLDCDRMDYIFFLNRRLLFEGFHGPHGQGSEVSYRWLQVSLLWGD